MDFNLSLLLPIIGLIVLIMSTVMFLASRYKRCPSDEILVIFGKVGEGQSSRCIHGGGAFVWPLIQDSSMLSLTPMTISIPLSGALSMQNIRINVPSTFTVGISTDIVIMKNAAERLRNLEQRAIEELTKEIIFGQLRLTVASLTIEQINQDRESFLESIRKNVEPELNKIGLYLINVNITDITDESNYIESIGKKAASEAVNKAKVDVAEQEKLGSIGHAVATKEKEVRVAENVAEQEKGKKKAESERRIFVQQQESAALVGEANATRDAEMGKNKADAERRVFVQQQYTMAIEGENLAKQAQAASAAELGVKQADALRVSEVARKNADVEIQKATARAETERLTAEKVVPQEIEKRKIEIAAEAEAEKTRRIAKGVADGTLAKYEAEAKGIKQVLESKASGYKSLVLAANGDARAAATLLMTEKIEEIVKLQIEAIKNIKIDKVTVWDSGGGANGVGSTANFLSGLVKSLPPMQEVAKMAGVELPSYLGTIIENGKHPEKKTAA